ncbi:MAG: SDR family oxidoreductase [Alphaproteobacteria bacterium]|nr:SDR family oxidoreductase [Alphaproteobacteria bacterium]
MPTAVITGANRGLGLEFARVYLAEGWTVHAGCRHPTKADALRKLKGDLHIHPLDVDDPKDVKALGKSLGSEPVDLLLNNAGIFGKRDVKLGQLDYDEFQQVLKTNVVAPMRLAEALADNVAHSRQKKMAFVTSRMGSIGMNSAGGQVAYRTSKSALNMAVSCLALDLKSRGVTCLLVHPGWVKTDMGGPGAAIEIPESIAGMKKVIDKVVPGDTGKFFDYQGQAIPW